MSTHRVLVSDKLSDRGLEVFRAAPSVEVDYRPGLPADELMKCIGEYDALAVRSGTQVTPEVIEVAAKLKVVGRAGIGVDNINLAAASQRGIVVMNTPDGNVVTTAEHAIALMCALTRHIPQATASMREGKWQKSKFQGKELYNKTIGIIGLGNIGKIVADRARGLKMRVIAFDPYVTEEKAKALGAESVDLDTLLRRADVVSLHVPLVDATRNIIDAAAIEKMKPGALLVNAARGGLVDEQAVADAVTAGRLGGAAFDVYSTEPPPADNPLLSVPGIILTPHLGASTSEAQDNVAVAVAEQIVDFLVNGAVANAVNAASVPAELMAVIGPYLHLGRKVGALAGQLHDGDVRQVRVSFQGAVANEKVDPISVGALAGLLALRVQNVNEINAPLVAKERGIEVITERNPAPHDFVSTVGVQITGGGGSTSVVGAIFGSGEPRIVQIDGLWVETVAAGHILITRHQDRPGVIGKIGSILGSGEVNIARMNLSLDSHPGVGARAAITIDSPAPAALLDQIRAIDGIEEVRAVEL